MKILKFVVIIIVPFIDIILAGTNPGLPINLLRITPLVLAIAVLYDIRKFFIRITIAALFFVLFNYPYDIQALFSALAIPALFVLRKLFFFLSEQWLIFTILFFGFSSGYAIWLVSNISLGLTDYRYFFYGFVFQVVINVLVAFLLLKIIERFAGTRSYEIPTRI